MSGEINLKQIKLDLSPLSSDILKMRYLKRDEQGTIVETPIEMFYRVAKNIAQADKLYVKNNWNNDVEKSTKKFFDNLIEFNFVPASPILMNAGNTLQSLFSDHALDVPDNLEQIFDVLKFAASIQQHGGGLGFSFSKIRPVHDDVQGMKNVAFGPLKVMNIFDTSFSAILQGGRRSGANMAVLDITHPDIVDFIESKNDLGILTNFNLSVAVSDDFIKAVEKDKDFDLINPRTKEVAKTLPAKFLFEKIAEQSWKTGDPGIIFIDEMNRKYPFIDAKVLCTGSCGQYELESFEGIPYAHINLTKMLLANDGVFKVNKQKLKQTVHDAVHFLDNCIDMHKYISSDLEKRTKQVRKIGLGIMGFADMLFTMHIPYGSEKSLQVIKEVMKIVQDESRVASKQLAEKRGTFPLFEQSTWKEPMRNATITSIAPTGTTSMIAHVSQSIEPVYALSFTNKASDGTEFTILNKAYKEAIDSLPLPRVAKIQLQFTDSVQNIPWLEQEMKDVFKTAMDITPLQHLKVMATFQEFVDNSISKTINLPNKASVDDVMTIMMEAHRQKCKGLTIYRDGCRDDQVLTTKTQTRLYAFEENEE